MARTVLVGLQKVWGLHHSLEEPQPWIVVGVVPPCRPAAQVDDTADKFLVTYLFPKAVDCLAGEPVGKSSALEIGPHPAAEGREVCTSHVGQML